MFLFIYLFIRLYRHIHNTSIRTTQSFNVKHKHVLLSRTPTDLNLGFVWMAIKWCPSMWNAEFGSSLCDD